MQTSNATDIHQLLTSSTVRVGLSARTKDELLDGIVDLLRGHPSVDDLSEVRHAVFDRERVMSTGVGKGLALPHAKTAGIHETVAAFATLEDPVEFNSIDNKPVELVFLLVGTEAAKSQHIKLLSRISRLMNRDAFRERLLRAKTAVEVLAIFEEGETELLEQ